MQIALRSHLLLKVLLQYADVTLQNVQRHWFYKDKVVLSDTNMKRVALGFFIIQQPGFLKLKIQQ